jgi:hypothetical protein
MNTGSSLRASLIQSLAYYGLHWNGQALDAPNPRWTLYQLALQYHAMHDLAIDPASIQPYLCPENQLPNPQQLEPYWYLADAHPQGQALWRHALQQWNTPVGNPKGFNLRLLLFDRPTGYLIGILGLCPATLRLSDDWKAQGTAATAFVMGAIPPYNRLRGSKLVALLAQSPYIRRFWWEAQIMQRPFYRPAPMPLLLIATYAVYGKSSVLNRLKGWKWQGITAGQSLVHLVATGWDKQLLNALPESMQSTAHQQGLLHGLRMAMEYLAIEPAFLQAPLPMGYYQCPLKIPQNNTHLWVFTYATESDHQVLVEFWKKRWATIPISLEDD